MLRKDFKNTSLSLSFSEEKGFPHEHFIAGIYPYTRGVYGSMYFKNSLEIITEINSSFQVISPKLSTNLEELIADTLKKGQQHIEQELKKGKNIDEILSLIILELPNLQLFDLIVFAKTIRTLWAKMTMAFQPQNKDITALKMILKISKNDISEIMKAVFCGVQYLYLPKNSPFSKEEWCDFIKEELPFSPIDPWGGNDYIEEKIHKLLTKFEF